MMLSKQSTFVFLFLALVASLVDARATTVRLLNETVLLNETDHDHEHDMLLLNETDHHEDDEMHLMNETDHHGEEEEDHHDDEMHLLNETDHHHEEEEEGHHEEEGLHEEELTEAEILALEAKCTCIQDSLYCSDAEGLEHCHCEGGEAHCEGHEEEHSEEHDDHDDHGDEHEGHDEHDDHDMHEGHDDHDDHGHSSETFLNEDGSKPWGRVIGMSFVINLSTLTGIFLIGGQWGRKIFCKSWKHDPAVDLLWSSVIIPMFACGALLATTVFLLLPEALLLIQTEFNGDGHNHRRLQDGTGEAATTWRWGTAIMSGFLIPIFLNALFPHGHEHEAPKMNVDETAGVDASAVEEGDTEKSDLSEEVGFMTICGCIRLKNLPLFLSFNLGEFLHCLADGFFVGAAYVGCGPTVGNSVVLASVLHEIPNQLAGYLVMVNQNGIDPVVALVINFVMGLATLLGGIIVLLLDLDTLAIGCIFAVGAGIFLHVAIAEMLGLANHNIKSNVQLFYMLLAFLVGAISIGLVLINHEHCGGH